MADKGPLLTSAIIFYLSIGAAIFQVLEEPNWKRAAQQYSREKEKILEDYPCLSRADLDRILEVGGTKPDCGGSDSPGPGRGPAGESLVSPGVSWCHGERGDCVSGCVAAGGTESMCNLAALAVPH